MAGGLTGARFFERFGDRLRLPLIAAPMFTVSGPDMVIAACKAGVIGGFPTANSRSVEELDSWLGRMDRELGQNFAPVCPNIIMTRENLTEEIACLARHSVEMVVTSVGSPAKAIGPLHEAACLVLADVASLRHAKKAIEAGADGLVVLSAGAGGQTGWANGMALVRAIREIFDGLVVLAGGISDGWSLFAAQALGCDLGYMGTRFIATHESLAGDRYKEMLISSELDDVILTSAFTGLPSSVLKASIERVGLDPTRLDEQVTPTSAAELFGAGSKGPQRWKELWSAGHTVSAVSDVTSVADLIAMTEAEFLAAAAHSERAMKRWTRETSR